jgi:hypothetical protein
VRTRKQYRATKLYLMRISPSLTRHGPIALRVFKLDGIGGARLCAYSLQRTFMVYRRFTSGWCRLTCTASYDVLVLAGDLFASDFASELSILRASPVPVLYIMGNDDNVALEYEDELIQAIHGRRVIVGDYSFVGYQYTPPFVGDAFVKTDAEIEADLPIVEPLVNERTIFVTHAPARRRFVSNGKGRRKSLGRSTG